MNAVSAAQVAIRRFWVRCHRRADGAAGPWALAWNDPPATGLSTFWHHRIAQLPAAARHAQVAPWPWCVLAVCVLGTLSLPTLVATTSAQPPAARAIETRDTRAAKPDYDDKSTADDSTEPPPVPPEPVDPAQAINVVATVVDADSGQPIERFRLVYSCRYGAEKVVTWQSHRIKNFEHGQLNYQFERAWKNTVFRIDAEGYRPYVSEPMNPGDDAELTIKLMRDPGIVGRVRTPLGTPARAAKVALCTRTNEVAVREGNLSYSGHGEKLRPLARTLDDGTFHLPAEVDPWVIVVAHQNGYAEVTANELAAVDTIELRPWGRLEGECIVAGKPLANQRIDVGAGRGDVNCVLSYDAEAVTDDAGHFVVEHLPPVSLYVHPMLKVGDSFWSLTWFSGQVTIAAGTTSRIVVPRLGKTVIGKIAIPADAKLSIADFDWRVSAVLRSPSISGFDDFVRDSFEAYGEFMASDLGQEFRRDDIPVDERGRFRIAGLPETDYVLNIHGVQRPETVALGETAQEAFHSHRMKVPPPDDQGSILNVSDCKVRLTTRRE